MTALDDSTPTKTCTKCGYVRLIERFPSRNGIIRNKCKDCENAERRAEPEEVKAKRVLAKRLATQKQPPEVKEKRLAKAREYSKKNKAAIKEYRLAHYAENVDLILSKQRAKYAADKELSDRMRENARLWRINNQDRKNAANKAWAAANPEKNRESALKSKRRRRQNPIVRVHESMSSQMWSSLQTRKAGRKWESLVGYSVHDLVHHLEKQFRGKIGWHNYGEWQIDHITPVASFGDALPGSEEFQHCWSLANLRPIMASENASKRDKITHLI